MKYIDEVNRGMELLRDEGCLFVGQAVRHKGHAVSRQVMHFPEQQLIEMPVAEDFQAGFCFGLALDGHVPVCIFPRFNFAICATNQIVNHIDKFDLTMAESDLKMSAKVIIKVVVGSDYPLDPGWQHKANYSRAFESMCESITVTELIYPHKVYETYERAIHEDGSFMIIEHGDLYNG